MKGSRFPLAGVKVADFTQAVAGPTTTRMLAVYGATVVKVETHSRLDNSRTASPFRGPPTADGSAYFANYNSSKYSISVNLRKPQGKEIALKLISWADIVAENFAAGAMQRLGLDYESVKRIKPDIIYWANCQLGHSGPRAKYRGFGHQSAALCGMFNISGWPDRGPSPPYGAYTDFTTPYFAVAAILAALVYRRKTGKGLYLDQSQYESAIQFLAPVVMDCWVNGRVLERDGNRLPYAAPHAVYRCQGEDRWVALAVFTDDEWSEFCRVIGSPDWTKDAEFTTLTGRKKNEDELNKLVEQWTIAHTAEEIEEMMQAAGVAASVVENGQDLFEDAQLKHREYFQYLEHSVIGRHAYDAPSGRLSKTPWQMRPGPCIGQDNEYVLKELLGLSDDEIADLLIEGVITTEADLPDFSVIV